MSTCDHICRECGGVMNCQHCRPEQLPTDRFRIAELEQAISKVVNKAAARGMGDWPEFKVLLQRFENAVRGGVKSKQN